MNSRKQAIHKIEKLLISSEPKQTTMYMTLKSPEAIHIVKRLLETLLEPFGDEVLKKADRSLHPMNLKDKNRIEKWQLACEFQTDLFEAPTWGVAWGVGKQDPQSLFTSWTHTALPLPHGHMHAPIMCLLAEPYLLAIPASHSCHNAPANHTC